MSLGWGDGHALCHGDQGIATASPGSRASPQHVAGPAAFPSSRHWQVSGPASSRDLQLGTSVSASSFIAPGVAVNAAGRAGRSGRIEIGAAVEVWRAFLQRASSP
jgi:hypothetical protein